MSITHDMVSQHCTQNDCWVIINSKVYNITTFIDKHPGGINSLLKYAGKDITNVFNKAHSTTALKRIDKQYIGTIEK